MKVVILATGTLEAGGLERFVSTIALQAKAKGLFEPVVLCLHARRGIFLSALDAAGIKVLEAPARWQRNLKSWWALMLLVRSIKADIWHTQVNFSLLQQWILAWACAGLNFMVTERNCYPLKGIALWRRRVQFYLLKAFGVHYSGNSIEVSRHLSVLMRYPLAKIPVIPNGIVLPELDPNQRTLQRAKLGIDSDRFLIGYVARFAANKGQSLMLKVFKLLNQEYANRITLIYIGDGPFREAVSQQVLSEGLSEQIKFLGIVNPIADYYPLFDCTALLSDYEGMPNVVIEAMSFALPVVANPVGNVEELFSSGGGIVNKDVKPEKIAEHFIHLIENPAFANSTGQEARNFIHREFSIEHTLALLTKHYAS